MHDAENVEFKFSQLRRHLNLLGDLTDHILLKVTGWTNVNLLYLPGSIKIASLE